MVTNNGQHDNHDHCELDTHPVKLAVSTRDPQTPPSSNGAPAGTQTPGAAGSAGVIYIGNELHNRRATPDEAARAAADANAVATEVETQCDQFGIPKPPEGQGAQASSSPPPFFDCDGNEIHAGAILMPALAHADSIADARIVHQDRPGGWLRLDVLRSPGSWSTYAPESIAKFWRLAPTAPPLAPREPEDIAQALFFEIDDAVKTESSRRRIRGLVLKLLRTR